MICFSMVLKKKTELEEKHVHTNTNLKHDLFLFRTFRILTPQMSPKIEEQYTLTVGYVDVSGATGVICRVYWGEILHVSCKC